MEEELDSCRARLRTVEAQLLEVLQEKLKLKQEVEAWETCSIWFESGCGVSCRESPEAPWEHTRTQARAEVPGFNSPGVSGGDGGENGSRA